MESVKKGERVQFLVDADQPAVTGVAISGGTSPTATVKVATDDLKGYTVPVRRLTPSQAPLSERLADWCSRHGVRAPGVASFDTGYAKGDFVLADDGNGRQVRGMVVGSRGDAVKVQAIIDGEFYEMMRSAKDVVPAAAPPLGRMERWGIADYKEHRNRSEETVAFSAVITLDGVPVFHAENAGRGGCNLYHPMAPGGHDLVRRFEDDAREWARESGFEYELTEASDTFIGWHQLQRAFGQDAEEFFVKWNAEWSEMDLGRRL
jgi:hypothetical protein